jgi:hypothetical protein
MLDEIAAIVIPLGGQILEGIDGLVWDDLGRIRAKIGKNT